MSDTKPVASVIVLGGGSAGFIAAISLKTKLPDLPVKVIHSSRIGIIGVGEGSTVTLPIYLHGYLGIDPKHFHLSVRPTYKLGIRFLWGPRERFHYTFDNQFNTRHVDLDRPIGFFCSEDAAYCNITAALMAHGHAFERQSDGGPLVGTNLAYHVENEALVRYLQTHAQQLGIEIIDDTLDHAGVDESGISELHMASGQSLKADLYVDCSGFRAELIGKALGESFVDYSSSLFCDRAVAGGWRRTDEPLLPFTTAETMDCGWAWQIEHEALINRGYVFGSAHISDEQAESEFLQKNPKVESTRVIRFRSGRYQRAWIKNAVAIGNASGFVEPLEATALAVICEQAAALARVLIETDRTPAIAQAALFNKMNERTWESIRRFLALHYKLNTRLDTPFWQDCREQTDLAGAEAVVAHYHENGPTLTWVNQMLDPGDPFGWEGYLAMLVGLAAPCRRPYRPSEAQQKTWQTFRAHLAERAARGMPLNEALAKMRSEQWRWRPGFYETASRW